MIKIKRKLKLIWVNNCKLIEKVDASIEKKQEEFNKLKKNL